MIAEPGNSKLVVRAGHMVIWNAGYAVRSTWTGRKHLMTTLFYVFWNLYPTYNLCFIFHHKGTEVNEVTAMRGFSLHKV